MLMEPYHAMHDDIYSNISIHIKLEEALCTLVAYININIVMPYILYMCDLHDDLFKFESTVCSKNQARLALHFLSS